MTRRRDFVQSLAGATAFTAVSAPRAASAAQLIRYPYVQNVSRTSATIVWTTDSPGAGEVRFSETRTFANRQTSVVKVKSPAETELRSPYYRHAAVLPDLRPDTSYYYRVYFQGTELTAPATLSFRTAGTGPFRFLAFGDSGAGSSEQRALAQQMLSDGASLVTHLGDIAYPRGSFQDYHNNYFGVYKNLMCGVPVFPCPGNHGYMTRDAFPYVSIHEVPQVEMAPAHEKGRYYSFDWGNVHFVSLDSNTPLERAVHDLSPMLRWLDQDLANTRQYWKIVYFHHPPYAFGPNAGDPLTALARGHIVPILERHGVHLVLNGHEHSYQRSHPIRHGQIVEPGEGTVYVTSGAAGAHLYPVDHSPFTAFGRSEFSYLTIDVNGGEIVGRSVGLQRAFIEEWRIHAKPRITAAVNSATGEPGLAPGALVSIYGTNLAPYQQRTDGLPLPEEKFGVRVGCDGQPAPLLFLSPGQINVQLPYEMTVGETDLRVRTAGGEAIHTVTLGRTAPGVLSVAHADTSLVSAESPAAPGETLVLYAAGLGQTNPPAAAGAAAPDDSSCLVDVPVVIEIGGIEVKPETARLASNLPGVYLIVFQVPESAADGNLRLNADGAVSPVWELAILR